MHLLPDLNAHDDDDDDGVGMPMVMMMMDPEQQQDICSVCVCVIYGKGPTHTNTTKCLVGHSNYKQLRVHTFFVQEFEAINIQENLQHLEKMEILLSKLGMCSMFFINEGVLWKFII